MVTEPVDDVGLPVTDDTLSDRRRPGRTNNVNPELIALLRGTAPDGPDLLPEPDEESDQLAAARGLVVGGLLSLAFWLVICFLIGLWI